MAGQEDVDWSWGAFCQQFVEAGKVLLLGAGHNTGGQQCILVFIETVLKFLYLYKQIRGVTKISQTTATV